MSAILPVQVGTVPSGSCPADYQGIAALLASVYSVTLPDAYTSVQVSATKPTDTTKPWFQLDSLGRPVRLYSFAQGAWLSLHPTAPGMTIIWTSALPDFTTFDGGDSNTITPISGAMWEQVTDLNARVPVGAGTLPSSNVIAVGGTGGEELHVLTVTELAPHTHGVHQGLVQHGTADHGVFQNTTTDAQPDAQTLSGGGNGATPPAAAGHNNLQPYFGVYFLRRTARLFYAVSP